MRTPYCRERGLVFFSTAYSLLGLGGYEGGEVGVGPGVPGDLVPGFDHLVDKGAAVVNIDCR